MKKRRTSLEFMSENEEKKIKEKRRKVRRRESYALWELSRHKEYGTKFRELWAYFNAVAPHQ